MDLARFDALTRVFASSGSRRRALAALLGAALLGETPAIIAKRKGRVRHGAHGHDTVDLAARTGRRKQKHKRKPKGNGKPSAGGGGCFDGSPCKPGAGNDLQHCDLAGSSVLKNADCTACNLGHANLTKANLTGATLNRANLGKACLVDADLTGASLTKANLSDAILCRTRMADGTIDNSGCDKGTACCITCAAIGAACGNGLGGGCCGGAACVNDVCACPAARPLNCKAVCKACCDDSNCPVTTPLCCKGVCKACCDDGDCSGATPRCCNGVCRGCCVNSQCPSNVCCNQLCCPLGQVCPQGSCCPPEPIAETCDGVECGIVSNNCGQPINCGVCAEIACQPALCGLDNTCLRAVDPDLTLCTTATIAAGICCNGDCKATSDPAHCGVCGRVCPSDGQCEFPICTAGVCGIELSPNNDRFQPGCEGLVCCDGVCCNTFTNQVCAVNHQGLRVCCVPSGEFSNGFFGLGAPNCCSGQVVGGDICA